MIFIKKTHTISDKIPNLFGLGSFSVKLWFLSVPKLKQLVFNPFLNLEISSKPSSESKVAQCLEFNLILNIQKMSAR